MPSYNSGQISTVGFMVSGCDDKDVNANLESLRFRKKRIGLVTNKGFKFGVAKTHLKRYLFTGKFKHPEPTHTPSVKF